MSINFSLFIFDAMSYSKENSEQILKTYLYESINNKKYDMNNNLGIYNVDNNLYINFEEENCEKNSDFENLSNDLQNYIYKEQGEEDIDSIFNLKNLSLFKNIEENNEKYDEEQNYKENIENKKFKKK